MRVLVLSQYYLPEPVPKPAELAATLASRGHSVSVITGFPNYPAGRIHAGFRLRLFRREKAGDISIVRTWLYPYHGDSAVGRFTNYVSFMLSSVLGALLSPPCDIIYVWHPPLTIGLSAWIIGLLKRASFVYDVQDIWPESLMFGGRVTNPLIIWGMHRLERFIYRRARHLFVVTPGARRNLTSKGISPDKITVMPPWIDESQFVTGSDNARVEFRERYHVHNRFVVMYAGNMGVLQGVDTVIRCAALLQDKSEIVFLLVGDGVERNRLRQCSEDLNLRNVVFIERQSLSSMPAVLAGADILLVHLKASPLSDLVIPGKTMACLAAGRPIIMAANGAAADLAREARAGLIVPPEEPGSMAEAVLSLFQLSASELKALGQNGKSHIGTHYPKKRMMDHYEQVFAECK